MGDLLRGDLLDDPLNIHTLSGPSAALRLLGTRSKLSPRRIGEVTGI